MRERLIELLTRYDEEIAFCDICDRPVEDCAKCSNEMLAEYLLANGVLVPPCKGGDKIYVILYSPLSKKHFVHETQTCFIHSINGHWHAEYQDGSKSKLFEFGIKAFMDKEEAEKALKGGEE